MFDHRCVSFISLVLSGGPGITVRKRYLTSELAANFIELLHNSPALCNFIGNHLDSKLEPYPASIHLFRSVSSQSAVKILSFQLCVEHLSRSFCPGCCRVLVYSQVNITSCLFDQSPHIIFKTILLFFFFFLRMNWNHWELLSPDRCLPHWDALIRIQILTLIYSRFDSVQEELTGNIKPQLVNWRILSVWVTPRVVCLNLREIRLTLSLMKNKNHAQMLHKI